jgi:hypothetical protein
VYTVRKNLEIQENKAVQLVGAIRTLEKEKTSLKKLAARLEEKVGLYEYIYIHIYIYIYIYINT